MNVDLTENQIRALVVAAKGTAEIYRDSKDTDPSFKLQGSARSLEQAVKKLERALDILPDLV